jgi:uncharacterized paraquat-inducible protein A
VATIEEKKTLKAHIARFDAERERLEAEIYNEDNSFENQIIIQMPETNEARCPKCKSTSLHAGKRGFSGKQAAAGAVLTLGFAGLVAGAAGSKK